MNKNFTDRLQKVLAQVEYYFSDDNLSKDQFFHEKISGHPEGYLPIVLLLNCNKLKGLKADEDEVAQAAKHSTIIELSKDNKSLRRVGNKALPELILLNKKRKPEKDLEREESGVSAKRERESDRLEDVFLLVTSDKEVDKRWKDIQDEYQKICPDLNIVYLRFSKTVGHIGILHNPSTKFNFTKMFTLNGINFNVKKCEGEDLISFYKEHGSHYESCVKKIKRNEKKKSRAKLVEEKERNYLNHEVQLGNTKYKDANKINLEVKKILLTLKNGEKVESPNKEFIIDLLSFHKTGKEKLQDLDYITVNDHPEFQFSRCFFIVKKDGTKIDFSTKKCIEEIKNLKLD